MWHWCSSRSPLAAVHVLGVLFAADPQAGDPAHHELADDVPLLLLGHAGHCKPSHRDQVTVVRVAQRRVAESEYVELTLDGGVIFLERRCREQQQPFRPWAVVVPGAVTTFRMAERQPHDAVSDAAARAVAVLQVVRLVHHQEVGIGEAGVQRRPERVAKGLRRLGRQRPPVTQRSSLKSL